MGARRGGEQRRLGVAWREAWRLGRGGSRGGDTCARWVEVARRSRGPIPAVVELTGRQNRGGEMCRRPDPAVHIPTSDDAACFLVPDVDARGNTITHGFILVSAVGPYVQQGGVRGHYIILHRRCL
jgi:hypothetical protein